MQRELEIDKVAEGLRRSGMLGLGLHNVGLGDNSAHVKRQNAFHLCRIFCLISIPGNTWPSLVAFYFFFLYFLY